MTVVWTYEVRPFGSRWMAKQYLNGHLLKAWPGAETEEEAQEMCKKWEAIRR